MGILDYIFKSKEQREKEAKEAEEKKDRETFTKADKLRKEGNPLTPHEPTFATDGFEVHISMKSVGRKREGACVEKASKDTRQFKLTGTAIHPHLILQYQLSDTAVSVCHYFCGTTFR